MFGDRYYGKRYYGNRYFGPVASSGTTPPPVVGTARKRKMRGMFYFLWLLLPLVK